MSIDLRTALRGVVDDGSQGAGPWDGADRLAGLTARVRHRRAVRTATTSAVGIGAACAVGAVGTAAWWAPGPHDDARPAATAATPDHGDPVPPAPPVPWSDSALCGALISPTSGGPTLSLGLPGLDPDLALVGRSIGAVPVWLTVPADESSDSASTAGLDDAQVVVVSDGRVVAVADDAVTVVSRDPQTMDMLETVQLNRPDGSGDLRSCVAAPDGSGLAGHVPAAGEYTLHAVADLFEGSSTEEVRIVSPGVPLSLLPERPLLGPRTPGLPAGYPLDVVPIIGGTLTDSDHVTSGRETWKVTVEVQGDDALSRAAAALGSTGLGQWNRLTGAGSGTPLATDDPVANDPEGEVRWWRSSGPDLLGSRYREGSASDDTVRLVGTHLTVNVREVRASDEVTTLEYLVTGR